MNCVVLTLANHLRYQEVFARLNQDQLALLNPCLSRETAADGQRIVTAGEPFRDFFLLLGGDVHLFRETPVGPCSLHSLSSGDLFGEEGFVDGGVQTNSVEPIHQCDLIRFNARALDQLLETETSLVGPLYWAFWHSLAARMRTSNRELLKFFDVDGEFIPSPSVDLRPSDHGSFKLDINLKREVFQEQKLSTLEIKLLTAMSVERRLDAGQVIFHEGDTAESMYVVLSGKVRIGRQIPGAGEEALAILGRGEYFGQMALLSNRPRSADARAHDSGTVVLEISRDVMRTILNPRPNAPVRLLKILCSLLAQRVRALDDKIAFWHLLSGPQPSCRLGA